MSFNRPTLQQLIERAQSDIDSRLPGTDPRLRYSVLGALARTLAGAVHGVYGMLAWLARQLIPDTAEAEILALWADIWIGARTAAIVAVGNVDFTGTNGTLIPAGTELQRADGALFTTDADATIALGVATAAVTASVAGAAGNTDAGSTLTLTTPIGGLNSTATVAAGGLANGTDLESDDALRTRLLERLREPPHGGSSVDYVAWAKEVAGVTRVWPFPLELGDGTVVVRFVRDNDASIIPDAAEVAAVQAHLDEARPATADVTAAAPAAVPLNFTIAIAPNTAAVQQAVEAELTDLIDREGYPGGTIPLSHIREAISIAAGETDHVLTAPVADVVITSAQIGTMGVITWS